MRFLSALILTFSVSLLRGQAISERDYSRLIPYLENEDWKNAGNICGTLLAKFTSKDTTYDAANIRYMYLVSVAGQLAHKDLEKEVALKKVSILKGTRIITPGREFRAKGGFNLWKAEGDSTNKIFCCTANNAGTEIQIFEHYALARNAKRRDAQVLEGKAWRIHAVVKDIKADGFAMPRLEVDFVNAYISADQ